MLFCYAMALRQTGRTTEMGSRCNLLTKLHGMVRRGGRCNLTTE